MSRLIVHFPFQSKRLLAQIQPVIASNSGGKFHQTADAKQQPWTSTTFQLLLFWKCERWKKTSSWQLDDHHLPQHPKWHIAATRRMITADKICFFFYCATTRQTEGLDFVQLPKWTAHLPDKHTNNDKWYTFLSFAPKLRFHPRWSLNHLTINSTIKSTNMMVWLKDLIHRFKSIHRKAPLKAVNLHSMHLSICFYLTSDWLA